MTADVAANSPEKSFEFKAWVSEGVEGMKPKPPKVTTKFLPEGFRTHMHAAKMNMKAAKKECLMALRSFLDEAIERSEAEPPKRATKVKVE